MLLELSSSELFVI